MNGDYKLSFGNMKVLQFVPLMMQDPKYRRELRKLYLEYMVEFGHSEEVEEFVADNKKLNISS